MQGSGATSDFGAGIGNSVGIDVERPGATVGSDKGSTVGTSYSGGEEVGTSEGLVAGTSEAIGFGAVVGLDVGLEDATKSNRVERRGRQLSLIHI